MCFSKKNIYLCHVQDVACNMLLTFLKIYKSDGIDISMHQTYHIVNSDNTQKLFTTPCADHIVVVKFRSHYSAYDLFYDTTRLFSCLSTVGKLMLSPWIMSVQYTGDVQYYGGCSVHWGIS